MRAIRKIKDSLSGLLLRGWLLDAWLRRKTKRLAACYTRELVRVSKSQPRSLQAPAISPSPGAMRQLLLIADVMWEETELVPELKKICSVETLNLRPLLQSANPLLPVTQVVCMALTDFIRSHANCQPDVVLLYARSKLLSDELFEVLRRRWKCPFLGMNLDEKTEFLDYGIFSNASDGYQHWARKFDLNLSNVRAISDWYGDRGLPVHYMAEGYHPRFAEPTPDYRYELSFVGSRRPERDGLLRRLAEFGVSVKTMGAGWPGSSSVKDPGEVYRASQMNLGIGYASPSLMLTTLKARDFECPGSGACYLTTWNWELALHYDIGREILCYRNEEELVEIFSYYRRRPEECTKIAMAAWKRCIAEHTWERRFRQVFGAIGFRV